MNTDSHAVKQYLIALQDRIVAVLAAIDGKPFRRDAWDRPEGGSGISCLIEEGNEIGRAHV